MEHYERIDNRPIFDGKTRDSHELRYYIASGFIDDDSKVIDAGCGVGYGMPILMKSYISDRYVGLDKNPPKGLQFKTIDFEDEKTVMPWYSENFDVFIGFEIIEHLDPVGFFIQLAKNAKKWVIVSTPIVPNSNPYHKQQFTEEMMVSMFSGDGFEHYATLKQGPTYGIFIFKRTWK